eukprot:m.814219 g.814219  ORF g.814219 m.814219 type:complete len:120 (+) comp23393_c0_seq1:4547-4906(+)
MKPFSTVERFALQLHDPNSMLPETLRLQMLVPTAGGYLPFFRDTLLAKTLTRFYIRSPFSLYPSILDCQGQHWTVADEEIMDTLKGAPNNHAIILRVSVHSHTSSMACRELLFIACTRV